MSAWLGLAEAARRQHLYVDAERHYTAALAARAGEPDQGRKTEAALAGRGSVRYRMLRLDDALADVRAARALAEAREDAAAVAHLLLEEATILDWRDDYQGSQAVVDRAAPMVERLGDARLTVRWQVADGRGAFRRQDVEGALARLEPAARGAEALGDHESWIVAHVLIPPLLVYTDRLDEAEARFAEVIARCRQAGDRVHLGVAHANRLTLHLKREAPEAALADLRIAVGLAHEIGHPNLERGASHNLAELLYWSGAPEEALPFALRALDLYRRFSGAALVPDYPLLVARIYCARGDTAGARPLLDEIRNGCPPEGMQPSVAALFRLCEHIVAGGDGSHSAWAAPVADVARTAQLGEHVEALCFAASAALRAGRRDDAAGWLDAAKYAAGASRFWAGQLARLTALADAG
jgi:tetratricopeptide (TPR) repeat protein